MSRESWSTRGAFVLAAIGSAVGLGNLWGFPYKLYTYGGGAFLIPYFFAMLLMGVPLLIMEFAVGHWAQQAPPDAFGRILRKYRFVGWWLVSLAFVIITYYAVILGYCIDYLAKSVQALLGSVSLPWAGESSTVAADYFLKELTGFEDTMVLATPMKGVVVATIASWLMIYFCLFRGVKWVSRVVLITVPLPWIMLVILTVRGLTLEGAIGGLEFYLEPRWGKLLEPDTWRFAFSQVFFSMSLGFAVMLSYASFLHRKSDLNNNAMIIGLSDMGTSFVAGIAVFSMLGAMSVAQQVPVPELVPDGTVGLSFMVFPYGLSQLPYPAFFSVVFFLALLTLGIDSAFSIVEACLASICDSKPKWPRKYVLPGICLTGAVLGLVFTAGKGGLNWLGLVDGLINGPFGILIVALAECIIVGWAWKGGFVREMRNHANERSDWNLGAWWEFLIKYLAPAVLSILIVWSISGEVHAQMDKYRAANTEISLAYQQLQQRLKDEFVFEGEAAEIELTLAGLRDSGACGPYSVPVPLLLGSAVFCLIPILAWLVSRGRRERVPGDRAREGSARAGIIFAGVTMLLSAVVIELGQARDWFASRGGSFQADGQLNATAYIFLAVALVVIFGGLIWCFWRAMQAAGRQDPDIPEGSN